MFLFDERPGAQIINDIPSPPREWPTARHIVIGSTAAAAAAVAGYAAARCVGAGCTISGGNNNYYEKYMKYKKKYLNKN